MGSHNLNEIKMLDEEGEREYQEFLLKNFYGNDNFSQSEKVKKCCEYLKLEVPQKLSEKNLEISLKLLEFKCLEYLIIEDHQNM